MRTVLSANKRAKEMEMRKICQNVLDRTSIGEGAWTVFMGRRDLCLDAIPKHQGDAVRCSEMQ
jgi:hypothetical protein